MRSRAQLCALAVLVASLFAVSTVHAETTVPSTITQIQILTPADKRHQLFHGVLWLNHDKARYNYRWGGKHCGDQGLSEVNVSLLFAAFRSKYNIAIHYKKRLIKSNTYRCITGFTLARN